jgi:hypothetical protein
MDSSPVTKPSLSLIRADLRISRCRFFFSWPVQRLIHVRHCQSAATLNHELYDHSSAQDILADDLGHFAVLLLTLIDQHVGIEIEFDLILLFGASARSIATAAYGVMSQCT